MNDDTIHTSGYVHEVGPRTKLPADKPHLSRNMNGDLLLIDGEKRSIVATSFSALWYAIVAFGDGEQVASPTPASRPDEDAAQMQIQDSLHLADSEASAKSLQSLDALHGQIMNVPKAKMPDGLGVTQRTWYNLGHRDARHAAAELVAAFASSAESVSAPLPVQGQEPSNVLPIQGFADWQQRRGIAEDILDEAQSAYMQWMIDDDYDAHAFVRTVFDRIEERRAALRSSSAPTTKGTT